MDSLNLGEVQKSTKTDSRSREELIQRNELLEFEIIQVVRENYELRQQKITDEQLKLVIQDQLGSLKQLLFGTKSERYKKPVKQPDTSKEPAKPKVKKPSERYPHLPIREQLITMSPPPSCQSCGGVMKDSGMTEDSEQLTVIPKKYEILLQKKVKFTCQCSGCILTAPTPDRIIPGSTYSDEMILDIVLSKYCDLIPIGRYAAMAGRSGLVDLPPHSLIEVTHPFADFVSPVYSLIKKSALTARILQADETPHRMLEGSQKKNWYLWGFSTPEFCFLECRNTRSANVASSVLAKSQCQVLLTDVYTGYGKAVREANEVRRSLRLPLIRSAHCNAHARRPFFQAFPKYPEAQFYLDHYHEIYQLNSKSKGQPPPEILEFRAQMRPRFEAMKKKALEELPAYPKKTGYGKGIRYFLKNYEGLTLFLEDPEIPIDNNSQERLLRSHVVGRKTWYGTHSERGALTAAILFTLVETCKLNEVNPREYFKKLTEDLLAGHAPYTPVEFKTRPTTQ